MSSGLTATAAQQARAALIELAKRQVDALRLYEPMPAQDKFHRCKASEIVVRGGNRSGKSTCAFVEDARCMRRMDPYQKYPDKPLLMYVIGYDQDHIGRVVHRMLFRAGVFKIIRDQTTGKWRAFRPSDPADAGREAETKPSPPLIPPSEIKEMVWLNKGERVFSVCRLKNGNEIRAFSSKAEPAQGDPVDIVHIDEDLYYERWVGEMQARLSDTKGRLYWSAFPHSRNDALLRMSERAEEQAGQENPDVAEFVLTFSGNLHIDSEQKRKRLASWSDEECNARDLGQFTTGSVLMYPSFSPAIHGAPRADSSEAFDQLVQSYKQSDGSFAIPSDWCRYLAVDPGHTVCAVLFAAVPPDYLGDYVLLYDECYLKQCDATKFGEAVSLKTQNQLFQAFVIDDHGSRVTQAGSGRTIYSDYVDAFKRFGVKSARTGHDFFPGDDDPDAGYVRVREWLRVREDQTTKLRYIPGAMPNFEREMRGYKKKLDGDLLHGGETRDVPVKRNDHTCDALRYLAMLDPQYVRPRQTAAQPRGAYAAFLKLTRARNERQDTAIYLSASVN